jgi:hypothetical protein
LPGTEERWLVAGGMIGIGLLLVHRALALFERFGHPRGRRAGAR